MKPSGSCINEILRSIKNIPIMWKPKKKVFYAVAVGRQPGVYNTWNECKSQVVGITNPKFKKFYTPEDAEEFVKIWKEKNNTGKDPTGTETSPISSSSNDTTIWTVKQKAFSEGDTRFLNHSLDGSQDIVKKRRNSFIYSNLPQKDKNERSHIKGNVNYNINNKCKYTEDLKKVSLAEEGLDMFLMDSAPRYFHMVYSDDESLEDSNELKGKTVGGISHNESNSDFSKSKIKQNHAINENILENDEGKITCINVHENISSGAKGHVHEISKNFKNTKSIENVNHTNEGKSITVDNNENNEKENISLDLSLPSVKKSINKMQVDDSGKKNSCDNSEDLKLKASSGCILQVLEEQFKTLARVEGCNNNCKSSVVTALNKVVDAVTVLLNEISSGIVLSLNEYTVTPGTLEDEKISTISYNQGDTVSNTFSGRTNQDGKVVQKEISNSENFNCETEILTLLKEKLKNCERKIDLCFGQISQFVVGLTEAKNELIDLNRIVFKNCNTMTRDLISGNDEPSVLSPSVPSSSCRLFNMDIIPDQNNCKTVATQLYSNNLLGEVKVEVDVGNEFQYNSIINKRKRTHDIYSDQATTTSSELLHQNCIKQEKLDSVGFNLDEEDYVIVYTDGACSRNGADNAKAGIGIWFGDRHPMNVSKPVIGKPTNNNAEIQAARIAIELALKAGISKLKIFTDSEFLINCVTKWMSRWKTRGWLTGENKPVKNRPELEKLDKVMNLLSVKWEKVEGHSGIKGNERADRLANEGAILYNRMSA